MKIYGMGYINSFPDGGECSEGLAGPPGPQGPKGSQRPKGDPGTGFKLASDGNFDIERKKLLNFYSGVNKGYVNEYFLKKRLVQFQSERF